MSKALLKSEWEVMQEQLKTEKGVLKVLEKHYSEALKAVNARIAEMLGRNDANLPHVIRRIEYQKMVKAQVQAALDSLHAKEYETISEYLQGSYTDAFVGTMYTLHHQDMPVIVPIDQNAVVKAVTIDSEVKSDLYTALGVDVNKLKKTIASEITRGIASGLLYDDITRNIAYAGGITAKRAKMITRTEAGRVQEQATFDAANKALAAGADVVKQWSAIRDGKTRDTHRALDGQIREVNEPFTVDGHKAMHPHGFGIASEDVNCRCTMLTRARAALDADELKLMQERAAAHGLLVKDKKGFEDAKAKDFADFKKKYLKAANVEENTDNGKPKTEKQLQAAQKEKSKQQPNSIDQENERGKEAVIAIYDERLKATGVQLIPTEELAKQQIVDLSGIDPRAAAASNEVLEKYAGKYNSWLAGVETTDALPVGAGGYTEISGAGGTGTITLNAKMMKDYDQMVEAVQNNGLSGDGVRVKPEYYDQYILTHEFGHTLLQEDMTQKSAVGVDRTVYQKAMKEAKQAFADYKQEYHDLSNQLLSLRNEEIRLNNALMDDEADVLDLMEQGKKLASDLKETESKLASLTISRYASTDINEFIAEAWTEREIGENPGKYSKKIGSIIDKYFRIETPQTVENTGKSGIIKRGNVEVRKWYLDSVSHIPDSINQSLPMTEKAKLAFEARNRIRTEARDMMADEAKRNELDRDSPNPTFEQLVESKMRRKKMTREEAIEDIYKTATTTNERVNKELGLDGE